MTKIHCTTFGRVTERLGKSGDKPRFLARSFGFYDRTHRLQRRLALWLSQLGAKIHGYALEAPTTPSFFIETQLHRRLKSSTIGDIRDLPNLISAMRSSKPSIVFHMAAQPLVLESYKAPAETFTTNVIGTESSGVSETKLLGGGSHQYYLR